MPGHYSNTSGILANTTIDAADVKTPVDALDDALYAFLGGGGTAVVISGGTIDATVIGGITPAAVTATTVASTGLTVNADGSSPSFRLTTGSFLITNYNNPNKIVMRRAQGTPGSETQVVSGNSLAYLAGEGWTNSGAFSADTGIIRVSAAESFTSSAQGTLIEFQTTPIGSTTTAVAATIGADKKLTLAGDLQHNGTNLGFFSTTAAARQPQAALTGTPQAGTFATGTVTLAQLAGVVMNMIATFRTYGLFS